MISKNSSAPRKVCIKVLTVYEEFQGNNLEVLLSSKGTDAGEGVFLGWL